MKKFILVVSFLHVALFAHSQIENPIETRDSKLESIRANNNVKSATIVTYRVVKGNLSPEGRSNTLHYGTDGVRMEKEDDMDDDKGFTNDRKKDPKLKTEYDAAKKMYSASRLGTDNKPVYLHSYVLDDGAKIKELQVTDYARGIRYSKQYAYDANGNEMEMRKYTTSGRLLQKIIKSYYKNNLPKGRIVYEPSDNIKQVSFYEYDFY